MTKERFILIFPPVSTTQPLTYRLIKEYDVMINILKGEISAGKVGRLLVEIEADQEKVDSALQFLKDQGVDIRPISDQIRLDIDKCVHCGACTSVCFSGALDLNRDTWQLEFTPGKCVACGLCSKACPLRLFTIEFGNL